MIRKRTRFRDHYYPALVEHLLSPEILVSASLRGKEYAWPPSGVKAAIRDAVAHRLATIGGQAQFRLPDATCELYWINIEPSARRQNEPWDDWVTRSAEETVLMFNLQMASTDWNAEIAGWPFLRDSSELGVDVLSHLCFVLYFCTPAEAG